MTLVEVLRYGNIAILVFLAALSLWEWRRQRSASARWIALMFASLAGLFGLRAVVGDPPSGAAEETLARLTLVLAAGYPYFLYRFSASFFRSSRTVESAAGAVAAALGLWGFLLPPDAPDREPRPGFLLLFIAAILAAWTVFSLVAAGRLWRAGHGQPTVVRHRVRLLAVASLLLTLAVLLVGFGPSERPLALDLVFRALILASAILSFVGFAPPRTLRIAWRQLEQERFRAAIAALMKAESPQEVLETSLPQLANIVGARALALLDGDGRLLGAHAATEAMVADLEASTRAPTDGDGARGEAAALLVPTGSGTLLVWASPLAPFFGKEELEFLRALGNFTELAMDHARLLAHERSARLAVERTSEMKDTFLAAVSHELRTPLTAILGFALTLQQRRDRFPPAEVDDMVGHIVEQARKLERLLGDLLDLDRLARGAALAELRPVDLGDLVERVVAGLDAQGRAVEVEAEPVVVDADAAKVERIVENLLVNAVRHTPPTGRIWARATREEDGAVITVEDEGRGVPPELRERIFEPFERGDDPRAPGTGIGLALVARFAELHGGRAWVEGRPGGGASFRVVLPLSRTHAFSGTPSP